MFVQPQPALPVFLLSICAVLPASTSKPGVCKPPALPCPRYSAGPASLPRHLGLSPAVSKPDSAEGPSTALNPQKKHVLCDLVQLVCVELPPASGALWSTGEAQKSLGLCILVNVSSVLNTLQSILYDVQ